MPELLMATAIATMALSMAFSGYGTLLGMFGQSRKTADCQADQVEVFQTLETDIRNAGADPLGKGLFGSLAAVEVVPAGESLAGGLRLRADLTGSNGEPDGDLSDAGEVVVYLLDSKTQRLQRWASTGGGGLVAGQVGGRAKAFTFSLLTAGQAAATGKNVDQVQVSLTGVADVKDRRLSAVARPLQATFVLRNQ